METKDLAAYIPDYILGKVPDNIKTAIERETEENAEFKQEIENQKALMLAAQLYAPDGLHDKIQSLQAAPLSNRRPLLYWAAAAAAIVILLVVGLTFTSRSARSARAAQYLSTAFPDHISAPYAEQLSNPGFSETEYIPILLDAMEAYNAGRIDSARLMLEAFLEKDPQNHEAQFYLGETLWLLGKQDDAMTKWQEASTAEISIKDRARLRLLAAYLAQGQHAPADSLKGLLQELAAPDIQQTLDEIW